MAGLTRQPWTETNPQDEPYLVRVVARCSVGATPQKETLPLASDPGAPSRIAASDTCVAGRSLFIRRAHSCHGSVQPQESSIMSSPLLAREQRRADQN